MSDIIIHSQYKTKKHVCIEVSPYECCDSGNFPLL